MSADARQHLNLQQQFKDAHSYEDVITTKLSQFDERRCPLRVPSKDGYMDTVQSSEDETIWGRFFISLNIENGNSLQHGLLTNVFDFVGLMCGEQIVEEMDGPLNTLQLLCHARQRLQWYTETFRMLRKSGLPKLVSDTVLSFCAIEEEEDAGFLAIMACKVVQTCSIFYDLILERRSRLSVPICLTPTILRPHFMSLSFTVTHTYADEKLQPILLREIAGEEWQRRIQSKAIIQTRYQWHRTIPTEFAAQDTLCRSNVMVPALLPISCILLRVECPESLVTVEELFEEMCLDFNRKMQPNETVVWTAKECFAGRVGQIFWFCVPLFDANTNPMETILCDDLAKVGKSFFYCRCTMKNTCCNPVLLLKRNSPISFDLTLRTYFKVWNQWITSRGAAGFWINSF